MVMTLLGRSLNQLFKQYPVCTVSTQVRVGINILHGLKQLHEVCCLQIFFHKNYKLEIQKKVKISWYLLNIKHLQTYRSNVLFISILEGKVI